MRRDNKGKALAALSILRTGSSLRPRPVPLVNKKMIAKPEEIEAGASYWKTGSKGDSAKDPATTTWILMPMHLLLCMATRKELFSTVTTAIQPTVTRHLPPSCGKHLRAWCH